MDESIHAKIKKNKQAELTERQKIKKTKEVKPKKQRRSKLEQIYQQLKSRQN
jgi:hypothetical protein